VAFGNASCCSRHSHRSCDPSAKQRSAEPIEGIAVAQHRRRRVCLHTSRGERVLERIGCHRGAIARECEAGLDAMSVDHLARDHLEMALVLPVPTADVAAIQPKHDPFGWLRRPLLRHLGDLQLPQRLCRPATSCSAPHRTGVLRPADQKQPRQQRCDLAEGRQRRIPGRHVGQFRRHSRRLEVERCKALCRS